MLIEDRIKRWRNENRETEAYTELLCDAEDELRRRLKGVSSLALAHDVALLRRRLRMASYLLRWGDDPVKSALRALEDSKEEVDRMYEESAIEKEGS